MDSCISTCQSIRRPTIINKHVQRLILFKNTANNPLVEKRLRFSRHSLIRSDYFVGRKRAKRRKNKSFTKEDVKKNKDSSPGSDVNKRNQMFRNPSTLQPTPVETSFLPQRCFPTHLPAPLTHSGSEAPRKQTASDCENIAVGPSWCPPLILHKVSFVC